MAGAASPVVADVFLVLIPFQGHVAHSVASRALVLGGVAAIVGEERWVSEERVLRDTAWYPWTVRRSRLFLPCLVTCALLLWTWGGLSVGSLPVSSSSWSVGESRRFAGRAGICFGCLVSRHRRGLMASTGCCNDCIQSCTFKDSYDVGPA